MTHPAEFYICNRFFPHSPRDPWGGLSDGPVTRAEAEQLIIESFTARDNIGEATLETVYVLHVQPDAPARNVTEDVLCAIGSRLSDEVTRFEEFPDAFISWADEWVREAARRQQELDWAVDAYVDRKRDERMAAE